MAIKIQRVKCNLCGAITKHIENELIYANGDIDNEEFDWCILCGHCVRGSIRRIKVDDYE